MVPDKLIQYTGHGKTADAIYNLLLNRQDQARPISQTQIGQELGIGVATVHRRLKRLVESGLVLSAKGKSASSYKVSTLHSITRSTIPIGTTELLQYQEEISSLDSSSKTPPSIGIVDRVNSNRWWEPTSFPPLDTGKRLGLGSVELVHLVAWFEHLVLPRSQRKITEKNRRGWMKAARRMLVVKGYPLSEVVQVVSWIFTYHDGLLPGIIECDDRHRKLTSLNQISWYYHRLVKERENSMYRGRPRPEPEDDPGHPVAQGQELIDQIEELTGLWKSRIERFNRIEVSEKELASWAKTFRISLTHRKIPFTDLRDVLVALADPQMALSESRDRFRSPIEIWLRRDEWGWLQGEVLIAQARRDLVAGNLHREVNVSPRPKNEDGEYVVRRRDQDDDEKPSVAPVAPWKTKTSWGESSWEERRERASQGLLERSTEVA